MYVHIIHKYIKNMHVYSLDTDKPDTLKHKKFIYVSEGVTYC